MAANGELKSPNSALGLVVALGLALGVGVGVAIGVGVGAAWGKKS